VLLVSVPVTVQFGTGFDPVHDTAVANLVESRQTCHSALKCNPLLSRATLCNGF
jgi:hypothetical protein